MSLLQARARAPRAAPDLDGGQGVDDLCGEGPLQRLPPQVARSGQATGDDDDVGIDDGDQSRQRPAQTGRRVAVDLLSDTVPRGRASLHLASVGNLGISPLGQVAAVDLRAGGHALEVPRPAACAGFALRAGDRHVTDLAGHVMGTPTGSPLDNEGTADSGTHRHHEDDLGAGTGAEPCLTSGVGVDVVLDVDRQRTQPRGREPLPHTGGDPHAGPPGDGVGGGQDRPVLDVNDTGGTDADRHDRHGCTRGPMGTCRNHLLHQGTDGLEHGGWAVVGRGRAGGHRPLQGPVDVHQGGSHLGAAEVESDDERDLAGR